MKLAIAQARLVWRSLLLAEVPMEVERWAAWADASIVSSESAPPEWLSSLAVARTREAALVSVSEGLGLEAAGAEPLDPQTLVIGFVVGRHIAGELDAEAMWAKLAQVADVAEFLDSGKWRPYASPSASGQVSSPLLGLLPVANFAHAQATLFLRAPRA